MKTAIRCLTLLLFGSCALAFSWGFGFDAFFPRHAVGNIPPDEAKTATEPRTAADMLRERLLRLGFTPEARYGLVKPIVGLDEVCAALHCRPEDFSPMPGVAPGDFPWVGNYGAPAGYHLYRRHFHCRIWTFDNMEPSAGSVVQVAVFFGENRYPDCPQ